MTHDWSEHSSKVWTAMCCQRQKVQHQHGPLGDKLAPASSISFELYPTLMDTDWHHCLCWLFYLEVSITGSWKWLALLSKPVPIQNFCLPLVSFVCWPHQEGYTKEGKSEGVMKLGCRIARGLCWSLYLSCPSLSSLTEPSPFLAQFLHRWSHHNWPCLPNAVTFLIRLKASGSEPYDAIFHMVIFTLHYFHIPKFLDTSQLTP